MDKDKEKKIVKHNIYTVSLQDLVDIWIESLHPDESVVVIWDAKKYLEDLRELGFLVEEDKIFDNKILTIQTDSALDAFYLYDYICTLDNKPYMQVYVKSKLITDNIVI